MDSKTLKYILKRLLLAIVTLWIIITITFLIMHAVPGSPFIKQKAITQATMDALNAKYGLDKPLFQQYLIYLGNAVRLDFGESISYKGRTVMSLIGQGFATSAFLGICAAIIALIVGLALGSWAATHRGKFIDQAILVFKSVCRTGQFCRIYPADHFPCTLSDSIYHKTETFFNAGCVGAGLYPDSTGKRCQQGKPNF